MGHVKQKGVFDRMQHKQIQILIVNICKPG